MTSPDPSDRDELMRHLLDELAAAPAEDFPEWEDAADLGRLHLQAFARDQAGGFELGASRGELRLTGRGVRGHSLDLADAGQMMSDFQTLVTASGAALRGQTNTRGRLAAEVIDGTRLALTASPGAGSVVLEFASVADEAEERYPQGAARLDGEPVPLVQRSIDTTFEILAAAAAPGSHGEAVEALFTGLGPRAAAAARTLANTASRAALDLNVSWEMPGRARRRVRVTAAQSATFASILHGTGLDGERVTFTGMLRTVSDRRKIDLETIDPDSPGETIVLSIDRGTVDMSPYLINTHVEMLVQVEVTQRPGGAEIRTYTALRVIRIDA